MLAADHVTPGDQLHGEVRPRADLPDAHARALRAPAAHADGGAQQPEDRHRLHPSRSRRPRASPPASRRPTARAPVQGRRGAPGQGQRPHYSPATSSLCCKRDGGVLMRPATRSRLRPRRHGGLTPAAVICGMKKDDGTMARSARPDRVRAREAPPGRSAPSPTWIEYRSRNESLIQRVGERRLATAQGEFSPAYPRPPGGLHLALTPNS